MRGEHAATAAAVAAAVFWCERLAENMLKHMAELQAHAEMYHEYNTKVSWCIH